VFCPELIRLDPADTVAVCRRAISAGERVRFDDGELTVLEDVPQGHKVALRAHQVGDRAVKYGRPIGAVTAAIAVGEHVHVHNLASVRGRRRSEPAAS
jgi:altronate hydrolase